MSRTARFEQPSNDITEAHERIVKLYQSLHLLSFTTKPPLFTAEQAVTPDIVYHGLPNNMSFHIGRANPENTPAALSNWRGGARAHFILWHNRHQRNGTITTPYYLGTTSGDISTPFIITPKDEKRFRSLTPDATENNRWQSFMRIILDAEQLEIPQPTTPPAELTA